MKKKNYGISYLIISVILIIYSIICIIKGGSLHFAILISNVIFLISIILSWFLGVDKIKIYSKKQKFFNLLVFLILYLLINFVVYYFVFKNITYEVGHTTKFLWLDINDAVVSNVYYNFINSIFIFLAVIVFQLILPLTEKNKLNKKK